MKSLWTLVLSGFIASLSTSASATTFTLRVGSCPSALSFVLSGTWETAYLSEDSANELRRNPNRRAIVAGVLLNDALPNASMSVMSLGAIEQAQGNLSTDDFDSLEDLAVAQVSNLDQDVLTQLDEEIRERADGADIQLPEYDLDGILTAPNRFVIFGSSTSAEGRFLTASLFQYISSCIVNIQIGIQEGEGIGVLLDAVEAIDIRAG